MIRLFQPKDMTQVLDIWLTASITAHDFIPREFWESKVDDMREIYLPNSEIHVHEKDGKVGGFLALYGNTVAALFVSPPSQNSGVGTMLLQKAKEIRDTLQLSVYKENLRSVRFYEKQGFHTVEERRDTHTGHTELLMTFPDRRPRTTPGPQSLTLSLSRTIRNAMKLRIEKDCSGVDWQIVTDTLKLVGMAHYAPEVHAKAFTASHTVVFVYDGDKLVGFGRAISDGAYQAAVYDCAVLPEYQGRKLGGMIMDAVLEGVAGCSVILYAAPGKEGFYEKQGFSRMKTGMARFTKPGLMREKGFIE